MQASNCGARLLLVSIICIGIISFFLHLFTGFFFLIGAAGTKVCPLLAQDKLFTEVLDNPTYFNNVYELGKVVLNNGSFPLLAENVC